jgi:type IV pilus assembly protein PilQ
VSTTQDGDKVRMVIEPAGAWEHSAYQADARFVLEVRPVRAAGNQLARGGGYTGEKLSLNFQNIDVRALLQVIADFTNFNVVTSDTVTGNVTLRLKDVPWDQALDIILQSKGLGARKVGNVLRVAPVEELNARDQAELEAQKKLSDLEPLRTQAFQLNYTKADAVAAALLGSSAGGSGGAPTPAAAVPGGAGGASGQAAGRILSARGSVIAELRTNQLFVTDIAARLEQVQALILKIDIPVRQVLIEARIVEASDSFGRSLGVKLGGNDLRAVQGGVPGYSIGGGNNITFGNSYGAIGAQTLQGGTAPAFNDSAFVNLPADTGRLGGVTAATFALSLFSASANRFLNLELSALEAEGKGKIVSSPRVITADQVKALIEQGEELPFQAATASGATQVQFKKANLKLEVVPQITPEGSVILDVDINKDSVGRTTPAGFAIDTKHIKTQVLVENGGTVVIGGIFTQTEAEQLNKVPLLGDIPVMGNLFKNRSRTLAKTELLVFITPKVIVGGRVLAR